MKTAYLVYRPVLDYEESMDPHFICLSESEANTAKDKMVRFAERVARRMPKYPDDDEEDPSGDKWSAIDDRRREIIANAKWPFGINLGSDISYYNELKLGCVDVMPLPIKP